jgi:4-aminobutyrate aminotransferase
LKATATRSAQDLAEAVLYRCLSDGISFKIGQGNVLVLAPPLNIDEDDLWWALARITAALDIESRA